MEIVLRIIKYVFVMTITIGGLGVLGAIVRLALDKARQPHVTSKDEA